MSHTAEMLRAYARAPSTSGLAELIEELTNCAAVCTMCADACLAEEQLASLRRCIRLNLDCADVCETASRIVARQTEADRVLTRRLIEICAEVCRACAEECERHAAHMEHCRICAEACRACEQACQRMLEALPAAA